MTIDKKILLQYGLPPISPVLVSALGKIRQGFDEGGSAKPPIDLSEYLELGIRLATMSEEERKSLQFMFDKLTEDKK